MTGDSVDEILEQWHAELPALPVAPVGIVTRLARVRGHLDAALAEVFEGFDLTPADFAVLAALRRRGAPYRLGQARLMNALGLTSGTVSVRLARLERRGVVVREDDPADRRTASVRLTEEGLDLFDRIAPVHLHNEDVLLSALDDAEREQLAGLLRKLLGSFEQTGAAAFQWRGMRLEPAHVARRRRAAVGLPDRAGMLVAAVEADGAAGRAGVAVGDLVVGIGGAAVRDAGDLVHVAEPSPSLDLVRGDREISVEIPPR